MNTDGKRLVSIIGK